jgi:hypothetical protein
MNASEKLFKSLTTEELFHTLFGLVDNDYYIRDFEKTKTMEGFLSMLELYDLAFVASDKRILLTRRGEKVLQYLSSQLI